MDNVIMTILLFGIPLSVVVVSGVGVIIKIIKDRIEEQRLINDIGSSLKKLGSNGYITNHIDAFHPPNKGSNVIAPSKKQHKPPKLTNCKNCGAPLHSNKCEFCDTEYDW